VQTEHDEEAIQRGIGYIYFWPGGVTERAIVQLTRPSDETGLTVEVSPLTGRARIARGFVELPEELFKDEDYSERDEP
jgi:general secretion pathway protein H